MGGGVKGSVARFSLKRRERITIRAIEETGKQLGIDLTKDTKTNVVMLNEKSWKNLDVHKHSAAFYRESEDTLYIRRKYFARRGLNIDIHERLHARSGRHRYNSTISKVLEEGTVEYLTDYTTTNSFRTKATKFARSTGTGYITEPAFVANIMTIVGRKTYLGYWKKGFTKFGKTTGAVTNGELLQKDLRNAGYWKTANLLTKYYESGVKDTTFQTHNISKTLNDEIKERKGENWSMSQHVDIITYKKNIRSINDPVVIKQDKEYSKSQFGE